MGRRWALQRGRETDGGAGSGVASGAARRCRRRGVGGAGWRPELPPARPWSRCAAGVAGYQRRLFPPCATCARPMIPRRPCARPPVRRSVRLNDVLANTPTDRRDPARPWLLAPIDLQAIKAAGVTFAVSMIERVIEERARGNPDAAAAIRTEVQPPGRRRPGEAEAGIGGGGAAQAGADRAGRLEPVPGSRHRPGRGDFHQGAADGRGRHRHGCRHPPGVLMEQPGARGGAGGVVGRSDRRRDAGQRRESARRGRALGAAARQGEG